MEVFVNPEAVNKLVADAVLKSAIGKQVEEAVKRAVEGLSRTYDNPIDNVLKYQIAEMCREVLVKEHSEAIKKKLTAKIADKLTDDFIDKLAAAAMKSY